MVGSGKVPNSATRGRGISSLELQNARLHAEILSLKTVAQRLDAWMTWKDGVFPRKGEWKTIASQLGVSPEALYREIAKRRRRMPG